MKILVLGAGVLGSLYAARLQNAGNEVTVLARGRRLADLRQSGIILEDADSGVQITTPVAVIEHLAPDDSYDLVIVLVRKNQLASVLPILAASRATPNVLFMVNNAAGPQELIDALGRERVMLGFAGAGGQMDGPVVRASLADAAIQRTTLGELDGQVTPRLEQVAAVFKTAGFPVALCSNMDAWLKTHVALVSPIANAIYAAGGDNYRLADTRDGLLLMVRAVREGFKVLRALHIPITPPYLQVLEWVPEPLLVAILARGMAKKSAELVLARHANAARDEMRLLADEFRQLVRQANIPTPAIDRLYAYLDPAEPALPEGSTHLPMDWRGVWLAAVAAAAALLAGAYFYTRSRKQP